jgi:RsiW-degrading membrane proteinase PrsW (M82 family)
MLTFLIFAAILPSLILMFIIWKEDTIEKESPQILTKLFFLGVAAAFAAMVAEMILSGIMLHFLEEGSVPYTLVDSFLVVAVWEEFFKFFFCYKLTWKSPEFNYRFDGVVYMVFTSLGFAAMENVLYLFSFGAGILPMRALFSIPAHMGFAVFMGTCYGTAKIYDAYGSPGQARMHLIIGYVIAVLLHGFYDTAATFDSSLWLMIFFIFVVVMDILVIRQIKTDSKNDRLIHY